MSYADATTNDPNPIKRWIHRRRFAHALRVFGRKPPRAADSILDFGGGIGELLRVIHEVSPALKSCLYEPIPVLAEQARAHLRDLPQIEITSQLGPQHWQSFDFVFCLEVFEHLPPKQTADVIELLRKLAKPGGVLVVGVPHEIFLPAIAKGLFRMARRYGSFDARWGNVLACAAGRPPADRPIAELAPGYPFHPHHLGFDFRELERRLRASFRVLDAWFSPVPVLGPFLNSEYYLLLQPN
jgi:SAM-dependent methyltransferase